VIFVAIINPGRYLSFTVPSQKMWDMFSWVLGGSYSGLAVRGTSPRPFTGAKNPEMARPPHNSGSYGKNGQVLAGADDLIQLINRKVIVGRNITT